MILTVLVVLVACAMWLVALRVPGEKRFRSTEPIYWWGLAFGVSSGVGTLITVLDPGASSGVVLALRVVPLLIATVPLVLDTLRSEPILTKLSLPLLALFVPLVAWAVGTGEIGMPALSVILLLPAIVAPRSGYDLDSLAAGIRVGVSTFIIGLACSALFVPAVLLGTCRGDKCSVFGDSIGNFGSGNALGVSIAILCGVCVFLLTGFRVFVVLLSGLVLVNLTSSRAALIGLVLVVVVRGVAGGVRILGKGKWDPRSIRLLRWGVAAVALTTFSFPFWSWSGADFTGRAYLWIYSIDVLFPQAPIFGFGSSYWVHQLSTREIDANYSTHSLATEMLVSGGIWCLTAMIVVTMVIVLRKFTGREAFFCLGVTVVWLSVSILEVPSAPGRIYLVPGAFALVAISANARSISRRALPTQKSVGRQTTSSFRKVV